MFSHGATEIIGRTPAADEIEALLSRSYIYFTVAVNAKGLAPAEAGKGTRKTSRAKGADTRLNGLDRGADKDYRPNSKPGIVEVRANAKRMPMR